MPIIVYGVPASGPFRAVLMTAKALGIEVEVKYINLRAKEQFQEENLKRNPAHFVPVIDDNGFILTECLAIQTYLNNKYAKDDSLYPKDPQKRAVVDSRLSYERSVLFPYMKTYVKQYLLQSKPPCQELLALIQDTLNVINTILENQTYFAGGHLTIADLALLGTISTIETMGPVINTLHTFPNIVAWLNRMKQLPYYDINQEGVVDFKTNYVDLVTK